MSNIPFGSGRDLLPPYELAQDFFTCGGDRSPGKCEVRGAGEPRKWDKRPGYGFSGAVSVYTGDDLSDFEIDVTIYTAADLEAWDAFHDKYLKKAPSGTRPQALGIYHPKLARLGIGSAVVVNVSQFTTLDHGGEICTISFQQYGKPKPALAKPNGAIPAAATATPQAQDELDRELAKAKADFTSLQNQSDALGPVFQ